MDNNIHRIVYPDFVRKVTISHGDEIAMPPQVSLIDAKTWAKLVKLAGTEKDLLSALGLAYEPTTP